MIGDLLGQPHIAACEVSIQILELVGSVLGFRTDYQLAAGLDLFQQTCRCGRFCRGFLSRGAVRRSGIIGFAAAAGQQRQHHHGAQRQRHELFPCILFHVILQILSDY